MKLRKFLTRKALIDFLRCLGMSEMKIKGHIGLEIMYGTICYHIGMHLGTFPSVHRQKKKKIRHLKRWMYAHRWFYQHSGSRHSLGMYIKIIIHISLYCLIYFLMFIL